MKMVGVTSAALNRKDLESCQQFFRQHANPHKCSTTQRIRETQNLHHHNNNLLNKGFAQKETNTAVQVCKYASVQVCRCASV